MALCLGFALSAGAQSGASSPEVSATYPLSPLRPGAVRAELGFDIAGQVSRLKVSVAVGSPGQTPVPALTDVVVERDFAGAVPFHLLVPLKAAFPEDGFLTVTATPVNLEGASGTPLATKFDALAGAPAFGPTPMTVQATPDSGRIVLEVNYKGSVSSAEVSVLGASALALRTVHGDLSDVEPKAFALARGVSARPRASAPGRVSFSIPTVGGTLPPDGVIIADVVLRDAFGRSVHTSAVEFTSTTTFDPLLDLPVAPDFLLLRSVGDFANLQVTGRFAVAGDVDLSGARHGVSYASDNPDIVFVTREGRATALSHGETTLRVTYGNQTKTVPVSVTDTAHIDSVVISPELTDPAVPRVGATLQLRLMGVLDTPDARKVDLTVFKDRITWRSSDEGVLKVTDGRVTSLRPGSASIEATYVCGDCPGGSLSAPSRSVRAVNYKPEIRLAAPGSVTAGTSFEVKALASDDHGILKVQFKLGRDRVPVATDLEAPYVLQVQAPPVAGTTLIIHAEVTDLSGITVEAAPVEVKVVPVAGPSTRTLVYETPSTGANLIEGQPQVLRVTSGDWTGGALSVLDFQSVRFTVDGAPLGVAQTPRVEIRAVPDSKPVKHVAVPLWEVTYVPPPGSAGSSAALRAVGVDSGGALAQGPTLLVSIVKNAPPLVSIRQPLGTLVEARAELPLTISGIVADDALSFGVRTALLVDGNAVATTTLTADGLAGSSTSSKDYAFTWTPPATSVDRRHRIEVQAIDNAGLERRTGFDLAVLKDAAPQIAIQTPTHNANVVAGSTLQLTAKVIDDKADPVSVSWYVNDAGVGQSATPPFLVRYVTPGEGGTLSVTALARDSRGQVGHSPDGGVTVHVEPDTQKPTAAFLAPRPGAKVAPGQPLLVTVVGTDNVDTTRVRLSIMKNDGPDGPTVYGAPELIHEDLSPLENNGIRGSFITHVVVPAAQVIDGWKLFVEAFDATGVPGTAEYKMVLGSDQPPTVEFVSPSPEDTVTVGSTLQVLLKAQDDIAVAGVGLSVNGVPQTELTSPPYRFLVEVPGTPGRMTLRATVRDSSGTHAVVEPVLSVNVVEDTERPMVAFRKPLEGSRLFTGDPVDVEVVAADNVAVTQATLIVNGDAAHPLSAQPVGGTDGGLYRVFLFRVPHAQAAATGTAMTLLAKVEDAAHNKAERSIELPVVANAPPQVTLYTPAARTPVKEGEDIAITFTVANDDGPVSWTGRSGGVPGAFPPIPATQDLSKLQRVVVRAPVISGDAGLPPTVGIAVVDAHDAGSFTDVVLDVAPDLEAPTVLLASPLPPREGTLEVAVGGSLGLRAEVSDDVRVTRMGVVVDGTYELAEVAGDARLRVSREDFEEVRTPNPQGPGDILLSRRYVGSWAGTVAFPSADSRLGPGAHTLQVVGYDAAGHRRLSEPAVPFEIVARQDKLPPVVRISLAGTPDARTCVAGSEPVLLVQATDDIPFDPLDPLEPLKLYVDGEEVTPGDPRLGAGLVLTRGGASVQIAGPLPMPALDASGPRTVVLEARAEDSAHRVTLATLSCELVADTAPFVAWVTPDASSVLVEEQLTPGSLELREDVGLKALWLALSSRKVTAATATTLQIPFETELVPGTRPVPAATLVFGEDTEAPHAGSRFTATVSQDALMLTPPVRPRGNRQPGALRLEVPSWNSGPGALAKVKYVYRRKNTTDDPFFLAHPSGVATPVTLVESAGQRIAQLDFPSALMDLEEVVVELEADAAGSSPLVSRLGLRYQVGEPSSPPQLRVEASGVKAAVEWLDATLVAGQVTPRPVKLRLPANWGASLVSATAVAVDTRGVVTRAERGFSRQTDVQLPRVAITSAGRNNTAVAGRGFQAQVTVSDNAGLAKVRLSARGVEVGEQLLAGVGQVVDFTVPSALVTAGTVELSATVEDRAGQSATSNPVFVQVRPDAPPAVELLGLTSAGESLTRTELRSGFVRLIQGANAELRFELSDDVLVKEYCIGFAASACEGPGGLDPVSGLPTGWTPVGQSGRAVNVTFRPPAGPNGAPSVLTITVRDDRDVETQSRLIIEPRAPRAPDLAMLAPATDAALVEGSIQLQLGALAGDDTRIHHVEWWINGNRAIDQAESVGRPIETFRDDDGVPIASDASVRLALATLRTAPEDYDRFRTYRTKLSLPPGFVKLDPNRTEAFLQVRVDAVDLEGHRASVERRVRVVQDTGLPMASFLRPTLGQDLVEGTPVLIQAQASDNAFVDRVELYAGPSAGALQLIHTAGDFPPENAVPGSDFAVYSPFITFQHIVPKLAALGGLDTVPYFVAVRARDVSGNWGDLEFQQIDIVRDREPALAIVSPADATPVVVGNPVTVVMAAEDDVGVTSVQLFADNEPVGPVLHQPPYVFAYVPPAGTLPGTEIALRGKAIDSFGFDHAVWSQTLKVVVKGDAVPTVALAQPRNGADVVEGQDFAVLVAAQDDVRVDSVEVSVEGTVDGTLHFVGTARPYSFRVPLPYGSAGRELVIRAKAWDSARHEVSAPEARVRVVQDKTPPTVSFASPVNNSRRVEGLRLDVEARAEDNVSVAAVVIRVKVGNADEVEVARLPAPPFRFSYAIPKGLATQGPVPLVFTAQAIDSSDNRSTAQVRVEAIADAKPSVDVVAPARAVVGQPALLSATASDDVAVAHVTFLVGPSEDALVEVGRRFLLPYDFRYVALPEQVGQTLWMQAKVVDSAGQETASRKVSFPVVEDLPPSVKMLKPVDGATLLEGSRVRMEANVEDAEGALASVTFFVDGRKVATSTAAAGIPGRPNAYVASYTVPVNGPASLHFMAVGVDSAGQEVVSEEHTVSVIPDSVAPQVELVDPPAFDVVTEAEPLVLAAAAEDNGVVDSVSFYVDGVKVGTSVVPVEGRAGRPLYPFTWLVPNSAAGQMRTLDARARDLSSLEAISQTVEVEVGMRPGHAPAPFFGVGTASNALLSAFALDSRTSRGMVGGTNLPRGALPDDARHGVHFFTLGAEGVVLAAKVPLQAAPLASVFHGNLALVVVTGDLVSGRLPELVVLDVTNLSMPKVLGSVDLAGPRAHAVTTEGHLAFVANGESGVVVVDLKEPSQPQRLTVVPVAGDARDVSVAGDRLLVAAGAGGLRVHDLLDPSLGEQGFVPVPGGAEQVSVVGARALVGCQGPMAALAVVDVGVSPPRLQSVLSHAPARQDLLATGQRSLAVTGGLAVSTVQLVNPSSEPQKGMLSASVIPPDGFAKTFVRANLPAARDVALHDSRPFALFGDQGVVDFNLPRFLVTDVLPADGADQVAPSGRDPKVVVTFTSPIDATSILPTTAVLRAGRQMDGAVIPATVTVGDPDIADVNQRNPRQLVFTLTGSSPSLPLNTDIHVVISSAPADALKSEDGAVLESGFSSRFRTRSSAGVPPAIVRVEPPSGPEQGGTRVRIHGTGLRAGARVFFSSEEATEVGLDPTGSFLTALTPPQSRGPVRVQVVNPEGLQSSLLGGFVYLPTLQVTTVSPATGKLAGGDVVELSGAGFQVGATVSFRGVATVRAATEVRVLSPGRISLKTPRGDFGPADLLVENPDGQRAEAPGAFLYSDLDTAMVLNRYDPQLGDGTGRPNNSLPQGMPGALVMSDQRVWMLSRATVASGATAVEVLKKSVQGALSLVDVRVPKQASVTGGVSFPPPYLPRALAVRGTTAYVVADAQELDGVELQGEGGPSLLVVDATVPTEPRFAYALPFEGTALGVDVVDDLALVAAGEGGLAVFSLRDPLKPMLLDSVRSFLQGGVQAPSSITRVRVLGRHAVLSALRNSSVATLVVDLARPGFPVVGEVSPGFGDLGISGVSALAAGASGVRTVSLARPTQPRVLATVPSLVPVPQTLADLGPHLGVSAGGGLVQLGLVSDLTAPFPVDAVDLHPGTSIADVAVEGSVIAASIDAVRPYSKALDGLALIEVPFPVVVKSQPRAGDTGVLVTTSIELSLSTPLKASPNASVRLMELDGSAEGSLVQAKWCVDRAGQLITLQPTGLLKGRTSYRVVAQGLVAANDAVMPGRFVAEFETGSPEAQVPVTLACLAPGAEGTDCISPREGSVHGGTVVKLKGTGFKTGLEVRFSGTPATDVVVSLDRTEVTLTTPKGAAGAATLEVRNPSGGTLTRVGAFLYTEALSLASVTPDRGPTSGGTRVVLQGTGFSTDRPMEVYFGDQRALRVRTLGMGRLEAYTPNGPRGPVNVKVVRSDQPGTFATKSGAFTYDQPTDSAVAFGGEIRDLVVIGDALYTVGAGGLSVVDLSNLYTRGLLAGTPIPPERRTELIDEDKDRVDDRILGQWSSGGLELLSVSYPPEGGDRLFVGGGQRDKSGKYVSATVVELDISNPARPFEVNSTRAGGAAAFALDARDDRMLGAMGADGLRGYDISHAPFLLHTLKDFPSSDPLSTQAMALAVEQGRAVMGTGVWQPGHVFTQGQLHLVDVQQAPVAKASVAVSVQRVRLFRDLAVVAAGDEGLVLVRMVGLDSLQVLPGKVSKAVLGGFASDVRMVGSLAYVAVGEAGVAVVDLSNPESPRLLHHVGGA
ncbi:Ig-like domain-containing protein, partial [Corallococcus praedator]|uniref:Ig-like domain-containing protein n=1 Tax=Corallococcus praedator TaxID=2316724 RepID=UPI001315729D